MRRWLQLIVLASFASVPLASSQTAPMEPPVILIPKTETVVVGSVPVAGATAYSWEVRYGDDTHGLLPTSVPRVEFTPLAGKPFRVAVRVGGEPWSEIGYELIVNPKPGDCNFDGQVNNADLELVRQHFLQ